VGSRFNAGDYAGMGRDYTIFSKVDGVVRFRRKGPGMKRFIIIEPIEVAA
jgi:large subunit ribosomal protein L27